MYLDGSKTFYHAMQYNGKSYSGTGDLFASVIMGGLMRGESLEKSVGARRVIPERVDHDATMENIPDGRRCEL